MQEFYDSDYTLTTQPGSSNWDSFEFGDELWKKIHKDKLEPVAKEKHIEFLFKEARNAIYRPMNAIL